MLQSHISNADVYRFSYDVYVKDLGKHFPDADHLNGYLTDSFDSDASYITEVKDNCLIGTCRINRIHTTHHQYSKLQQRYQISDFFIQSDNVFFISRLLIKKKYRSTNTLLRLLKNIFYKVKKHNDFIIVIDCSPALVPMYLKLGFKTYKENFIDEVLGEKTPLYFSYEDKNHLRKINSPVLNW